MSSPSELSNSLSAAASIDIFSKLNGSLKDYFLSLSLSNEDFFCKDCGKTLVDIDLLNQFFFVKWNHYEEKVLNDSTIAFMKPVFRKVNAQQDNSEIVVNEPEEFRWFLFGKHLKTCNKIFFRHICWDCFYAKLGTVVDIRQKARKSKWYSRIEAGEKPIPLTNIGSSDYFKLLFDITEEELQNEKLKLATGSQQRLTLKYGEEEGQRKFEEYRARQAYTNSAEYMHETRGMTKQEWIAYNASRAVTLENLVKRYGEEDGHRRWREYCWHEAYAGNSLQYFIDKYGAEDGQKKYDELCKKKVGFKGFSEISQEMFRQIDKMLGDLAKDSLYASKNHEKEIVKRNGSAIEFLYRVDYCLGNKVIEFNGDFWHANPSLYGANDIMQFRDSTPTAKDVWEKEAQRLDAIRQQGYEILVIWERDYIKNEESVLESCISFLTSKTT